jgi:hypothetical protein
MAIRPQKANRERVLACLLTQNATQRQIVEQTGLGTATVWRWLDDLVEAKEAHIRAYKSQDKGGPLIVVYAHGPKPRNLYVRKPKVMSDLERTREYRRRMRKSGDWEETLRRRRDDYWRKKGVPAIDPITAALFGR